MKYVMLSFLPLRAEDNVTVERLVDGTYLVISDRPTVYVERDGVAKRVELSPCDEDCIEKIRESAVRALFVKAIHDDEEETEEGEKEREEDLSRLTFQLVKDAILRNRVEVDVGDPIKAALLGDAMAHVGVVQRGLVKVEVRGTSVVAYRAR
ncbi:MAG: hypothetical protein QXU93_07975 [Thermoproteus sp.]